MTTRLKQRSQIEDEDASALKLGPGMSRNFDITVLSITGQYRVQQRRLSTHFGGQVPVGEQRQGGTGYCVRASGLTYMDNLNSESYMLAAYTIKHWST